MTSDRYWGSEFTSDQVNADDSGVADPGPSLVVGAPPEAVAAAVLLEPGQHLLARVGNRYFEFTRPA